MTLAQDFEYKKIIYFPFQPSIHPSIIPFLKSLAGFPIIYPNSPTTTAR